MNVFVTYNREWHLAWMVVFARSSEIAFLLVIVANFVLARRVLSGGTRAPRVREVEA